MKFIRRLLFTIILTGAIVFLSGHFNLFSIGGPYNDNDNENNIDYMGKVDDVKIDIVDKIDTSDYTYISKAKSDLSKGELILVNNEIPYPFPKNKDLVSVFDNKNSSYKVRDLAVTLHQSVMKPLNDMMKEFYNQEKTDVVTVISGHRTYDQQESLYNKKTEKDGAVEAMKWVAMPGGSEHHTGYALDFGIYHNSGRSQDYKGNGEYGWINENARWYGFIVRYPEDKKELTGIEYEPWHFRYIGKPHSYVVTKFDMCLEEYVDYLKQFQFGKKHLRVTDGNGKRYEIYFTDKLEVPVPTGKDYKISGNNIDGFIVTVQ